MVVLVDSVRTVLPVTNFIVTLSIKTRYHASKAEVTSGSFPIVDCPEKPQREPETRAFWRQGTQAYFGTEQ